MEQKTGLKGVKIDKKSTARLQLSVHEMPKLDLNQKHLADDYRASSPIASFIRPVGEEHHQKKCHADNQDHRSQETEKQEEEAESPLQKKEQSLLRRAVRILLMLFLILGVIGIFMIVGQYAYLDWDRILRSLSLNKSMNGFVKLCFVGTYNPPI